MKRVEECESGNHKYKYRKNAHRFEEKTIRSANFDEKIKVNRRNHDFIHKKYFNCYKCGREGHISSNCNDNMKNLSNSSENYDDIDMRNLILNNVNKRVLFDTGSSIYILTRRALFDLKNLNFIKLVSPMI
ncbi:hypothetical protein DMUE_3360 [Dictyocoela muelleri]|nr:hypothetical protein DMUE_3360 [Dictyocoela muelleri]